MPTSARYRCNTSSHRPATGELEPFRSISNPVGTPAWARSSRARWGLYSYPRRVGSDAARLGGKTPVATNALSCSTVRTVVALSMA